MPHLGQQPAPRQHCHQGRRSEIVDFNGGLPDLPFIVATGSTITVTTIIAIEAAIAAKVGLRVYRDIYVDKPQTVYLYLVPQVELLEHVIDGRKYVFVGFPQLRQNFSLLVAHHFVAHRSSRYFFSFRTASAFFFGFQSRNSRS
jgi:hypothetical protein